MKKIFRILVLLMAMLLLAGCNTDTSNDAQSPTDKLSDSPTQKPTEELNNDNIATGGAATDNTTQQPTEDNTDNSTENPTDKPTEKPTEKPTDDVTDTPAPERENIIFSADFEKYSVVVDDMADFVLKNLAGNLTDMVNEAWGISTTLANDEKQEIGRYEILIGDTNRPETEEFRKTLKDGECGYGVIGNKIVILGTEDIYTEKAAVLFENMILLSKNAKLSRYMTVDDNHITDAEGMISVMSYNLKCGNSDNNPGPVSTMIKNYMPDLLGVQEADSGWMNVLKARLSRYDYACIGLGRDADDTGERSAIFYRKDKFELIEETTLWLSDTPNEVSKVEGSNCNRIVTMATFLRISDGKMFTYANTHLDHSNATIRGQQVEFLDKYLREFTTEQFIVTGDFNFQPDNRIYAKMMEMGYENCSQIAEYARGRDHNTYTGGSMIDFCFRFKNSEFEPYFYSVCDELVNGKTPSDHHPIFLILNIE